MKLRMKIMSGFLILALMLAAAGIFFHLRTGLHPLLGSEPSRRQL